MIILILSSIIVLFILCKVFFNSGSQNLIEKQFLLDSISNFKKFMTGQDIATARGPIMTNILGTANEDELVFEKLRINSVKAEEDIQHSYNTLTVENNLKLGMLAAKIPTAAIEWMYTTHAKGINCVASSYSITGIRIFYGLTSDFKKLQLFFQPVSFCRVDNIYGQGGERLGKYQVADNGKYYEYISGNQFTQITVSDKDNAFTRYRNTMNGIRFNRGAQGPRFNMKNSEGDIMGDVESVTYSMQELFTLAESKANKGFIMFWNSIKVLPIGGSRQLVKHMLVLSSDDVDVNPADASDLVVPSEGANFMNLSHICPPSCNGANYTFCIAY